jgi:pyruvate formate lyase activating enzyme
LVAEDIQLVIRIPLIPGFNLDRGHLQHMAEFLIDLGGPVQSVDLLPYHRLGVHKYRILGRSYLWDQFEIPSQDLIGEAADLFRRYGFVVRLGG